jgi:cytochrome c551/c552
MAHTHHIALSIALAFTLLTSPLAQASSALTVEMGCNNCHSNTFHPNAPSFQQLADDAAKRRGEAGAEDHLMSELRKPRLVGRIGAHEHLSEESARELARWILDGAH